MTTIEDSLASLDLNSKIKDTDLTLEWILDVLQKGNPKFVEAKGNSNILSVDAHDISEGKGYCSRVLKTTIKFDDPQKKEYSFIMKVPTEEFIFKLMDRKQMLVEILILHNVECEIYALIKDFHNVPLPEIYHLEKKLLNDERSTPVIMMEDLSEKSTVIGIFRSVTAEQCLNFARHFSEFQAHVELLDEKEWKGKFLASIYMRADLAEEEKRGFIQQLRQQVQQFIDMDNYKFSCFTVKGKAEEYDALTLCHGDSWVNNTLIKLNEDGSISDEFSAFIDWQTLFEGCALHDLSRFIVACADGEIRREVQSKAVDLYYDCLSKRLEEFGKKVRFTLEQAHELYELATVQQTQNLIKVFTYMALPLANSGNSSDQAKVEKIWLRLKLALEDAQPIIEKYDMLKKFAK